MSYTIELYLEDQPKVNDVRAYLLGIPGVKLKLSSNKQAFDILNSENKHICGCDGPFTIEFDDIPESLRESAKVAKWNLTIILSHPDKYQMDFAFNLGKYLVSKYNGIVFDCQKDSILWPKEKVKKLKQKKQRTPVTQIVIEWFMPIHDDIIAICEKMIGIGTEICPEALPTRYGPSQPYQYKYSKGKKEEFLQTIEGEFVHNEKPLMISWKLKKPFSSGMLMQTYPKKKVNGTRRRNLSVFVNLDAMNDEWIEKIRFLFVAMAKELNAFYGAAFLMQSGYKGVKPIPSGDVWLGLPDQPLWLTWYGKVYASYVNKSLKKFITADSNEGIFVSYSKKPIFSDQIKIIPKLPKKLVINRKKVPANLSYAELIKEGFNEIIMDRSGLIVHPKATTADFIPELY